MIVRLHDLRPGDFVLRYRVDDWAPDAWRLVENRVVVHSDGVTTIGHLTFAGGYQDYDFELVREYANPDMAARMRAFLMSVAGL